MVLLDHLKLVLKGNCLESQYDLTFFLYRQKWKEVRFGEKETLKFKKKEVIEMKVEGTNVRHVMSASTLIGDKVVNDAGEDIGKIEEIMLHVPSGKIAYAVLSFGGFLGIGDKLFAIPWEALKLNEDTKSFVLSIAKEKLEKAPGFDKDHWPDMADRKWSQEIYSYYGYRAVW